MSEHNIVAEWLQIAWDDYDSALHLFKTKIPKPLEIICYHCQQSAEKYLKGYLFYNGEKPPKTHEVDRLCDMCSVIDSQFEEIYDESVALTQYGIQPRYPYEISIDEYHMKQALAFARSIREFKILHDLHEKLVSMESQKREHTLDEPTI